MAETSSPSTLAGQFDNRRLSMTRSASSGKSLIGWGSSLDYKNTTPMAIRSKSCRKTERDAGGPKEDYRHRKPVGRAQPAGVTRTTLGPEVTYTYDKLDRVRESTVADPSGIRTTLTVKNAYKVGGQLLTEKKETTDHARRRSTRSPMPMTTSTAGRVSTTYSPSAD